MVRYVAVMDTTPSARRPLRVVSETQLERLPKFVSTGTAALLLGVTPPTVRALLDLGELKGHRVGRVYRVTRESVEDYLRRMTA